MSVYVDVYVDHVVFPMRRIESVVREWNGGLVKQRHPGRSSVLGLRKDKDRVMWPVTFLIFVGL
jgi:hypothetical protein